MLDQCLPLNIGELGSNGALHIAIGLCRGGPKRFQCMRADGRDRVYRRCWERPVFKFHRSTQTLLPIHEATNNRCPGPNGGIKVALCFHSIRYYYINTQMSWFNAQSYCKEHYHNLATIDSTEDFNMLSVYPKQAWIGLSDRVYVWEGVMGGYENSWRWSATGAVNPDGYQNWKTGEPDNNGANQYCVSAQQGKWADRVCTISLPFICFTGLVEIGLKYTYVSTSMTWSAARSYCKQNYTDLAMILDDSENTAAASVVPSADLAVWIGLYRVPWVWADLKLSSFFNWVPGQPDNLNDEHCVVMDTDNRWRDRDCRLNYPFLCHKCKAKLFSMLFTFLQYVHVCFVILVLEIKKRNFGIRLQTDADLSDPVIHNQIIQKLGAKLTEKGYTDFKLTWKTSSHLK
ncbi:hypothetical protein WMY93_015211 [Mugilogobius chulae]|uniref:C-type lectin domain-containing protein n=1 Tax=Mugilogobius chulae TaxID=88201 RepID=A0AAW0P9C7_9GOBI